VAVTGLRTNKLILALTGENNPGWLHMCEPGRNVTFRYNFWTMTEDRLYFQHISMGHKPALVVWKSPAGDKALTVSGYVHNGMLMLKAVNMAGDQVFQDIYSLQVPVYVSAIRDAVKERLVAEGNMACTQNVKLATPSGRFLMNGTAVWKPRWSRTRRKVHVRVRSKTSQAHVLISQFFRLP
jgi:hypothetical protein